MATSDTNLPKLYLNHIPEYDWLIALEAEGDDETEAAELLEGLGAAG